MTMPDAIKICFKKYAVFDGRARRKEFWYFLLFCSLMLYLFTIPVVLLVTSEETTDIQIYIVIIMSCLMAFMFLPFLAVTVRRLHDVGKSGAWAWLLLLSYIGLGILSFFWLCKEGNKGLNKYGPNPKEPGVLFTPVYVTCIKGSIAGMRVSGINIYIGSDAGRCQLIFPEEEPYVSRCHCVVCSKNSGIELIDLDSRYGTFLSDGTRLTPNVPVILRSGESFFVGTSNSMISVFMQ